MPRAWVVVRMGLNPALLLEENGVLLKIFPLVTGI